MNDRTGSSSPWEFIGGEYARQGGWLPAASNMIRWLRKAGCWEYAHHLEKEVQSYSVDFPLSIELEALIGVFRCLGHISNNPPANLSLDQQVELRELRRRASRFVQYRQRMIQEEMENHDRAAANIEKLLTSYADREPVVGDETPISSGPVSAATELMPDQFDLGGGNIVSELSQRQLRLLVNLKKVGKVGAAEIELGRSIGYQDPEKGRRALSELVRRTNDKLNDYQHFIEKVNGRYCLRDPNRT